MFKDTPVFSGYSVDDLEVARKFYGDTLGITVEDQPGMGMELTFSGGQKVFIYPKPDHQPATFTVLNFVVDDIDATVEELTAKGITMEQYDNDQMHQDEKGIARGKAANMGPDIAWFKDPAGNILSALQN